MRDLTIFLLAAFGLALPAAAAPCAGISAPGTVKVVVAATGVRATGGEVAFTVYSDIKARFLKRGGKLARVRTAAVAGTTDACFWLAPGTYLFALYHDANADHDFNRTLIAPREGYGFSNDAPTTFGLPSFDRVRIAIGPNAQAVRIRMRYP